MNKRNAIAKDLHTSKYRARIVLNKKRAVNKRACREKVNYEKSI